MLQERVEQALQAHEPRKERQGVVLTQGRQGRGPLLGAELAEHDAAGVVPQIPPPIVVLFFGTRVPPVLAPVVTTMWFLYPQEIPRRCTTTFKAPQCTRRALWPCSSP